MYIPIYTKPDDDDDDSDNDDATDYSVHMYLQTKCPKTETIWKIQVPYPRYYLDLPDGQLMIGGSKVVGTLGRLDAELIADNKREKKLLGLSVILSPWGRPNQKEKLTTGRERENIH